MASGQLSREEALMRSHCRHACHVMLFSDTKAQLFGRTPMRHIVLMQMRFDGLLGFPGGLVNPSEETLEAGLTRELLEELGVALPVSVEDHVASCFAPTSSPSSSRLILHFYVKKIEEEQIKEVERAAASTATDHGHEVLGMVRVPIYSFKSGAGLPSFLSHSFIGNARSQLLDALLRFKLVTPEELHRALTQSVKIHARTSKDLQAALTLT
ncbi:U8 snoRNA-decapping enzyme [Myripristis murdjan]|uniref:U8 snoRNA-decapping enzyme n=1 Tax=Myripristis murdjan TaxID=586833 RepID=A0A667XEY4_9TELE|nr:U8 snoRNA-decapping enzyme-like [Myripristis murdjan]XP_029911559.1 U8 snoRNA-decapping enzyme-like [Myripristis murdjan]XP_029911560.1 U8 snoRNA-decapping enzyme-like [Myripristis murdjan]